MGKIFMFCSFFFKQVEEVLFCYIWPLSYFLCGMGATPLSKIQAWDFSMLK